MHNFQNVCKIYKLFAKRLQNFQFFLQNICKIYKIYATFTTYLQNLQMFAKRLQNLQVFCKHFAKFAKCSQNLQTVIKLSGNSHNLNSYCSVCQDCSATVVGKLWVAWSLLCELWLLLWICKNCIVCENLDCLCRLRISWFVSEYNFCGRKKSFVYNICELCVKCVMLVKTATFSKPNDTTNLIKFSEVRETFKFHDTCEVSSKFRISRIG